MKTALTILFSLALLLAGLPVAFACPKSAPESCCHCCGHSDCCAAKSSQPTNETPTAPAPSSAQNDFQFSLWFAATLLTPLAPATPNHFFVASTPPAMRAVPLFTRDCAFLL